MTASRPDRSTAAPDRPSGRAPRRAGRGGPHRFHRPARRRAPERVPAARSRAAGVAHRLHRLGRHRDRARRRRRHLRRRPLHPAGARARSTRPPFTPINVTDTPPTKWLAARLKAGDRIGYDPWLTTMSGARRFAETCRAAGAELVAVETNPIDKLWRDRPAPPLGAVSLHPLEFAGEAAADKIARLQATLAEKKADAAVLAHADSIAWTFNIRGNDIAHTPAPLAFAVLRAEAQADAVHRRPQAHQHGPGRPRRPRRDRGAGVSAGPADGAGGGEGAGASRSAIDLQGDRRGDPPGRRHDRGGKRPGEPAQGEEECRRACRRPARPRARRRGDGALPCLARWRGAGRRHRRDRRRRPLAEFRAETAAATGPN